MVIFGWPASSAVGSPSFFWVTATGFGHRPGDDEKSTSEDEGRGTGVPVVMLVDVPALVAHISKLW